MRSNNAEPYRQALNAQLTYYMKKYKNLKLLPIADGENSVSKQVQDVQNFIAKKVNVLIVSPNQPDPLTTPVQAACAAQISEKLSKHEKVPHNWLLPITPVTLSNVNQMLAEHNPAKFR